MSQQSPATAEGTAANQITEMERRISEIEKEIRILEGRATNRNPATIQRIQAENELLRQRQTRLKRATYLLLRETLVSAQAADLRTQNEILRLAGVEFCQQYNVNPELWKNLASS